MVDFELLTSDIKELFIKAKDNTNQLSQLIDKYLVPTEVEKKENAEVSTPFKLRQEMLSKIDEYAPELWTNKDSKIFEPCCGKGGFVIDIYNKLIQFHDKKHILENMLYFADISSTNIFITKLLLDPNNEYKLNYYLGDTLKLDTREQWNLDGFDAVIGNPPYNDNSGNKGKGHTLWTKFVEKTIKLWSNINGYILFVHPSLWRQAEHPLQTIMKEKQIIYLEIHDEKDGCKTFKCNTRYDWYLIQNRNYYKNTIIRTQKNEIEHINLKEWVFIPNYNFKLIKSLITTNQLINILYSRSDYASDKKWVRKEHSIEYKYPVIYSVNRQNKPRIIWSNNNSKNGYYGIPKLIFGSGATGFLIDTKGEYAICEFCTAIVDDVKNLDKIKRCLESKKFKEVILATSVSKAEINRKVLKYFKKDFYTEFI